MATRDVDMSPSSAKLIETAANRTVAKDKQSSS